MPSSSNKPILKPPHFTPLSLVISTTLIAFLYVFLEWLFIITKPSFLQQAAFLDKVLVLFTTALLLTAVCLVLLLPYILIHAFARSARLTAVIRFISVLVPTLVLASLALLMIDNFTYTVFKFGIVSTSGGFRILYAVLFIFLGVFFFTRVIGFTNLVQEILSRNLRKARKIITSLLIILMAAFLIIPVVVDADLLSHSGEAAVRKKSSQFPDIILITADSLNASQMSAYGFEKDTTPFLKRLSSSSLVAKNAFANAQGTIGSITSLLTGRDPLDTRVLASTDILRDEDALHHLPGILRSYGYYSVQLSHSYYADAYKLNFQSGFDEANGRVIESNPIFNIIATFFPTNSSYFMAEISNRLLDRLGHIFFIRDMTNPYVQVTESPEKFDDQQKLDYALSILEKTRQPVFLHIHWMGTHGPTYHPERQVFSKGMDPETQSKYSENFYLDSILEFDNALADFYQAIQTKNQKNKTIFIVTADHSQRWTNSRLPLIMHFPASANRKMISHNVQYLDIAPTLLDYLRIAKPAWMTGQTLLGNLSSFDPLFTVEIPSSRKDPETGTIIYPDPEPPFYQFGKISVLFCNQWLKLDLINKTLIDGEIPDYQGTCSGDLLDGYQAIELVTDYLAKFGFDPSTLQEMVISQ